MRLVWFGFFMVLFGCIFVWVFLLFIFLFWFGVIILKKSVSVTQTWRSASPWWGLFCLLLTFVSLTPLHGLCCAMCPLRAAVTHGWPYGVGIMTSAMTSDPCWLTSLGGLVPLWLRMQWLWTGGLPCLCWCVLSSYGKVFSPYGMRSCPSPPL